MRNTFVSLHAVVLACVTAAALAADSPAVEMQVDGVEVARTEPKQQDEQSKPSRVSCMNQCNAAESRCSSEVRQARQECSRRAATGGRDPMTALREDDYTYFCGYFQNTQRCGSDYYSRSCQSRFQHRYGVCVDAMEGNVAGMRYDCMRAEREAQNFCREELRDCKAVCG